MDHGRSLSGVFYAGRICHGGDRIYKSENSGNILMKNMMDFVLGSIFFFIIGFALMFGGSNAFIGTAGFFHPKSLADADGMFNGLPIGVFMISRPCSVQHRPRLYQVLWQREPNSSLI